jgi:hypothetical protein
MKPKPKHKKKKPSKAEKLKSDIVVWERDHYTCQMCGVECPPSYINGVRVAWGPHHVDYISQSGDDTPNNKISLCIACHVPKAHQHIWHDDEMPKMAFMGKLYEIIKSDYRKADMCMAVYRVWERLEAKPKPPFSDWCPCEVEIDLADRCVKKAPERGHR